MVMVKNFSIRRERDMLRLELMCSSSKFKEKMVRLDVPVAQAKSLIRELQKAVRRKEDVEDVRYIG